MSRCRPSPPPAAPRQWCAWHRDWTAGGTAVLVAVIPTGIGPDWARYACRPCTTAHGILPWKAGQPAGEIRYEGRPPGTRR